MLQFNELRITPDNKTFIIDVSVINNDYYENVYIDSIIIDNQDTYVSNGYSSTPVYTYNVEGDLKSVRLELSSLEVSDNKFDTNMFFVYVVTKGTPSAETPCGLDNSYIMSTVINLYPFYQNCIAALKELNNNCTEAKGFIDLMLRLKAVELNIKTGNYPLAIKFWNKFFKGIKSFKPLTCGCNGRNT